MKKLIFKIGQFPHLSETFILAQIITAIKCGYEVRILVTELLDFDNSKHLEIIQKFDINNKIILENYKIPNNKVIRLFKWIVILVLNLKSIKQILHFYKENRKFSFTWLYQWNFYKKFDDIDIFHVQYGTNTKPLDILKKIGFKPSLIVTFHGHDAFFPINGFIPNNSYYDNLFKFGNLVTVNTLYLAEELLKLGCSKDLISIVPVGVDTNFFYAKANMENSLKKIKLITVGRLDKVKGHHYSIEVVNKLIKKGIDINLTIIGDGEEWENLKDLIEKYQLHEKIFMKGSKSHLEIRQALWDHDIYLLSAVALPNGRAETQGLATLEAQACGLPVIVFDSGGVKYTLEDGISGFVCEEFDIDCMIHNVEKLLNDFDKYKNMSNEAVSFVNNNFSQQLIDCKWKTIYSDLSYGK
jgi:colanic acid/amylovoran biosynthesis glycosyltransferase